MENCIFIFFERKTNLYSLLRPDLNLRSGSVILYKSSLSIIFPGRSIRMKKLSKFGRSTLSLLLCLTMLLTTFCFFDIGSVISEAIISKGDHALTEAGTTSNTFAEYSINLPELVYIKPGGKDSQYFLNSSTNGSVSEPTSSTSVLSFACSTARSVTFSVALYDSTLSSTVS